MPARFIFTPAAMPPNPHPTTTTRGVPAGPNNSVLRFTRRLLCVARIRAVAATSENTMPHRDGRPRGPRLDGDDGRAGAGSGRRRLHRAAVRGPVVDVARRGSRVRGAGGGVAKAAGAGSVPHRRPAREHA